MQAEHRRIERLRRLERYRAIARHTAALEVALAEGALHQLETLAARTRLLGDGCSQLLTCETVESLRERLQFAVGLASISLRTEQDLELARVHADSMQNELAQAELRRSAVESRTLRAVTELERRSVKAVLTTRRTLGTGLE